MIAAKCPVHKVLAGEATVTVAERAGGGLMDLGLTGRACVVTGASRGIGRETALQLCAEGASVLLVARDEERLREARGRGVGAGAGAAARPPRLALDVTAADAGERMLAAAERALRRASTCSSTTPAPPAGATSTTSPTRTGAPSTSST